MSYTPDELVRRGWDAETRRHRAGLARALDNVLRTANSLSSRLGSGEDNLTGEARQLLADTGDVAQAAAALEAANQLSFALGKDV